MGNSFTRALLIFAASIAASAVVATATGRKHSPLAILVWVIVGAACVLLAEAIPQVRGRLRASKGMQSGVVITAAVAIGIVAALLTPATPTINNTSATINGQGVVQQCLGKSPCHQTNVLAPNPTTTLLSTEAERDCPAQDPTTTPELPAIELCVVYWCRGKAVTLDGQIATDQIQYKLRPRIVNDSDTSASISIAKPSALRLLVVGPEIPSRWAPPRRTKQADDSPVLVTWKGKKYWAIAPNLPGDAGKTEWMRVQQEGHTFNVRFEEFATYWDGNLLPGHQVYWHPLVRQSSGKGVRQGDLVFSVPKNADTSVIGLALLANVNGDFTVLQVANQPDWLHRVATDSF